MKTIKLFILGTVTLCSIQACGDKLKIEPTGYGKNTINNDKGCLQSSEINPQGHGERINETYENGLKHGHWIIFEMTIPSETPSSETKKEVDNKMVRIKKEEGYYNYNKKEGFWKFYNKDGTIKDSVEYKNDIPVTNKLE